MSHAGQAEPHVAVIRTFVSTDADAVMALNSANVPEVGPMDRSKLDLLWAESGQFLVAELDDRIVGMLILLTEGAAYSSPNFRWFANRFPSFAYVDRIALSEDARGQGLGVRFYDEAVSFGRAMHKAVLLAEVNTVPNNPRSLHFHSVFGFEEVGREQPYDGDEEVAMLSLEL